MRKVLGTLALVGLCTLAANAGTVNYGWEDGGTILGQYGDIDSYNVGAPDPVYDGDRSLKLVDQAASGTPQAFVGWVTGLQNGDQVTAGFWAYDTTPDASPSGRIWGHYTNDLNDINAYAGSPGLGSGYSEGTGWSYLEYTWTFDSASDPTRNGWVIEARTYSSPGDTVWFDNLTITAPDHATIYVPVPEPASIALLALGGLALIRRR